MTGLTTIASVGLLAAGTMAVKIESLRATWHYGRRNGKLAPWLPQWKKQMSPRPSEIATVSPPPTENPLSPRPSKIAKIPSPPTASLPSPRAVSAISKENEIHAKSDKSIFEETVAAEKAARVYVAYMEQRLLASDAGGAAQWTAARAAKAAGLQKASSADVPKALRALDALERELHHPCSLAASWKAAFADAWTGLNYTRFHDAVLSRRQRLAETKAAADVGGSTVDTAVAVVVLTG